MLAAMLVVGAHDIRWTVLLAAQMALLKSPRWGEAAAAASAAAFLAAGLAILGGWWSPPLRALRDFCGL
jgi:predicted metal-binding membrane protein